MGVDPTEPLGFDPTERDRVRSVMIARQRSCAAEARWAHNPKVGGSKPPSASFHAGGLAQSVECLVCNEEAPGSKPGFSTTESSLV